MDYFIPLPPAPECVAKALIGPFDLGVDKLLNLDAARSEFNVDGAGLTVAILDTGLRVSHECFTGKVLETKNFLVATGQDSSDVSDYHGHGTNVTGIIAANTFDERRGVAPAANIVALKVIPAPTFSVILDALKWVNENAQRLNISVVNLSLGAPDTNFANDSDAEKEYWEIKEILESLVEKRIAVVAAAGNSYFQFQKEGMSIPAIFRHVISVGAVYDDSFGPKSYRGGSIAFSTSLDQITPFSQRLSKESSADCCTDIFSSGASVVSAGAESDHGSSKQDGTSQAAPTIAGVVLLIQQYYFRETGLLPPIALLQGILSDSSSWITDVDNQADNVLHTNKRFPRADAYQALYALRKFLRSDDDS